MRILAATLTIVTLSAQTASWSEPAAVRYEDQVCISYRARIDGPYLVVRATLGPGWHTFSMDNKRRAEEKLAGKQPLSIDKATEIVPAAGIELEGPWYETPPKDFSHPELRWFSWGFDREAVFVSKVGRRRAATARLTIRGQACTETICKNIDAAVVLPAGNRKGARSEVDLNSLTVVRLEAAPGGSPAAGQKAWPHK